MSARGNPATAAWPLHSPPAPLGAQFSNWHLEPGAVHALLGCLSEAHAMIRSRLHRIIECQDLYAAMGVAVQLAVCLEGLGEAQEADRPFPALIGSRPIRRDVPGVRRRGQKNTAHAAPSL